MASPLDAIADFLGAKSGAQLGAENKAAATRAAATKAAVQPLPTEKTTTQVMQQRGEALDAALAELRRQANPQAAVQR